MRQLDCLQQAFLTLKLCYITVIKHHQKFCSLAYNVFPTKSDKTCTVTHFEQRHWCVTDVQQGNTQEVMIAAPTSTSPCVDFGCTVSQVFNSDKEVRVTGSHSVKANQTKNTQAYSS